MKPKGLTLKSFPLRSTPLIKGRTPVAAISRLMSAAQPSTVYFGPAVGMVAAAAFLLSANCG